MKIKSTRILTMLLAIMLCMAAFSISALAVDDKTAAVSIVTTPNGTGTVVSDTTNSDGKEFLTIKTSDDHVFYLIVDKQKTGDNVYFLDAVTAKDLLSLTQSDSSTTTETTENTQTAETSTTSEESTIQTTSTPAASDIPQTEKQSVIPRIAAIVLLLAVVAGVVILIFKLPRQKAPAKKEKDSDEYDFLTDEDTEPEDEPETPDEEMEED